VKIRIILRHGDKLDFTNATLSDFDMLVEAMSTIRRSFVWNETTWIRKSDVQAFGLISDEEKTNRHEKEEKKLRARKKGKSRETP